MYEVLFSAPDIRNRAYNFPRLKIKNPHEPLGELAIHHGQFTSHQTLQSFSHEQRSTARTEHLKTGFPLRRNTDQRPPDRERDTPDNHRC